MIRRIATTSRIVAVIASAAAALVAGSTVASAITPENFCTGIGIGSGGSCPNPNYHGTLTYVQGKSSPYNGLSAVWVQNSAGTRVSAEAHCDSPPGCTAYLSYSIGSAPGGFSVVHNHGGYYSNFYGENDYA